jgi:acyl-coenzyme A synthetase/AMP-(fatty) acid ligase
MYGFESTVLLALQSGAAFCAERPFYPADICASIAAAPRPRALITTPIHLRALLGAELPLPTVDLVVSATAHLPQELAQAAESRFGAPLQEIYGSTETGQIASRRTAMQIEWQLWPGVRLTIADGHTVAQGGHVESPTRINDVVELLDVQHFLLHGRTTDLVNIAGKRSSFDYLNHQLNAIQGVRDGAFFLRGAVEGSQTQVSRLAAFVVAPGLTSAALLQQLRDRIDPVFLPRPLLLVDSLPRNGTGKLPQEALLALAGALLKNSGG